MQAMQPARPATVRRRVLTGAVTSAVISVAAVAVPAAGPAAAGEGDGPDLSRFYRQRIQWAACEGSGMPKDLQCGKVTVPLDYAHPQRATLDLAVARYRATGKRQGSVVLDFGGPGGPGVAELAANGGDFMDLTNGYDVVGFDPRGVGRSSPVSCGDTPGGALGAVAGGDAVRDPGTVLEQLRRAAAECARHSGPVLRHIGTVNVARDLDVIRQALGDRKLNYLGFSYGSRLGAVYAAQFPHLVGRMALDGVDTLTEPLAEQGLAGAEGQQRALDDFLDWCVKDIACPLGQDRRTAGEQMVRLVRSLYEEPVPTGLGARFTGQDLVAALGRGLYSRRLWPPLERALSALVDDGDTRGVEAFASGGAGLPRRDRAGDGGLVDPEDVPADNLPAALMAVDCADDPDRPAAADLARQLGRLRAAYEHASPVFGRHRLAQVLMCHGRPPGTDFIRTRVKDVRTPKLLLVGTRGDPATPYRWALETARRLGPSAVVLDNRGDGHTGYGSSTCVHRKVDDFLLYGSLPADGSSCPPDEEG
ncbi:alpha/beta hydrolase [Streptomyces echinoruber]|uniref:Protease n=1 Tax=Streptomyces echinoruber TaxID=68898 RepID=A0A918VF69_9ACTN|nr:alpha/beta hydrolase [Streptomyces echinoruber]GGZ96355.1 protease [Streptomyces echinoruber]